MKEAICTNFFRGVAALMALAPLLAFNPASARGLTPAGTVIRSAASVTCKLKGSTFRFESNPAGLEVARISLVAVDPPNRTVLLKPGKSATLSHRVINGGNAADCFELEALPGAGVAVELLSADGVTPLSDSNGNGRPDTGILPGGTGIDIVVKATAADSANPGTVAETRVKAVSSFDSSAAATITDTATVATAVVWKYIEKSVAPPGQITQGTVLTYSISFGLGDSAPGSDIVISDPLDPHLYFVEGSATLPSGIPASFSYDVAERTASWTIPSTPPGYSGTVTFQARVDPETDSDTTIVNTTKVASSGDPEARVSNVVLTPVVEQPLRLTVTTGHSEVEIGDFASYTVTVENVSKTLSAQGVAVRDALPDGFRYARGSSVLDGAATADPSSPVAPVWEIGVLPPGGTVELSFRAIVSPAAPLGEALNSAHAVGTTPGGNGLLSPGASATVQVVEGVLNGKASVLGRIFVDRNRDLMPDDEEPGVPGVRLYLEDGSFVVTDTLGKFSFYGVYPGDHVLKLDRATLPASLTPQPLDSSFAGDGATRFVIVPFGGMARGDFGLWGEEHAAMPQREAKAQGAEERVLTFTASPSSPQPPGFEEQITAMPKTAAILEPAAGATLGRRWADIVVRVPDPDSYSVKVNGAELSNRQIGKRVSDSALEITIYRYIGVKLLPGINTIQLESRNADGVTERQQIEVIAPGDAVKVSVSPDKSDIPADGKTELPFSVSFHDRDGCPAPQDISYTVSIGKGEVVERDLDPRTAGHQLKAVEGKGLFHVRSTLKTGADQLLVTAGTGLSGSADIFFTPELRDWVVVGIGSLAAGSNSGDAVPRFAGDERLDEGIYQDGRLSFFAKGQIPGKYLVTAAYDSDKAERSELFQRVEPDRYYPIYGDASLKGYEAESQEKYYLRIEKERSQLLAGDFNTDLTLTEFSRYQRSFNGVKADIDTPNATLRAFGTSTSRSANRDELQGNGTSGYYFLRRRPVVENSEKIRIEVRDRYRPEVILSAGEKAPYLDYSLDYRSGALLFREPVPSHDPNLNPVRIVVLYESDQAGDENYIYGGRAGLRSGRGSQIGATAVVEETGTGNNTLYGVDVLLALGEQTTLGFEGAVTDTVQKGRGSAWKTEARTAFAKGTLDAYYRQLSGDFHNISMTGSETGTRKYGAKGSYSLLKDRKLIAESLVHDDNLNESRLVSHLLGVSERVGGATIDAGYRFVDGEDDAGRESTAHMGYAGVTGKLLENLDGALLQEIASTSRTVKDYPSRTVLKLNYKLSENTSAFLTEEYRESGSAKGSNTLFGVTSRVNENVTLTTTYQESPGNDGKREFGTEANTSFAAGKDLSFTTRTGYQIQDSMSGNRGQAILGVGTTWEAFPGVRLGVKGERVHLVTGSSDPAGVNSALAFSADYLEQEDLKLTGRYEWRDSPGETAHLASFGAAHKLNRDLSLLGKGTLWISDKSGGTDRIIDVQAGGAYRPPGKNSLYLIAMLRFKEESRESGADPETLQAVIPSVELSERLRRNLTLHGKYAGKLSRNTLQGRAVSGYSDMLLAGATYDITDRWDLDLSARLLNQYETGVRAIGVIPQTGYRVVKNARLSVGCNFARLDDGDLSGQGYRGGGPFVQFRFKFDEASLEELYAGLMPKKPKPAPPPPAPPPALEEPPTALLTAELSATPVQLVGSAEALKLLVNDTEANLPEADAELVSASGEMVELKAPPHPPLQFSCEATPKENVASWTFTVAAEEGRPFHALQADGPPPPLLVWNGDRTQRELEAGAVYRYRLETVHSDGSSVAGPYRLFGVNRSSAVSLKLTGGALKSGSALLSRRAKEILKETAVILRRHPEEKVLVEGHTDSVGSEEANLELSRRRAEAAAAFLIEKERIPKERIAVRWFGETRPLASNDIPEGRELNRRVEIKGEYLDSRRARILDQYRQAPFVVINGAKLDAIDSQGRFTASIAPDQRGVEIEMGSSSGRLVKKSLHLPGLVLNEPPEGSTLVPYPCNARRFAGRTEPGNSLTLDGKEVEVAGDGSFRFMLSPHAETATHWLLLRNSDGYSREFKLTLLLTRQQAKRTP